MIFDIANVCFAGSIKTQSRNPCKVPAMLDHMNPVENPSERGVITPAKPTRVNVLDSELPEYFVKKFWGRVNKTTEESCWEWTGTKSKCDQLTYGTISINKRKIYAHRMAYKVGHGKSPGKLCVCHACDNPLCCNPSHLWLGTKGDNIRDCRKKGRMNAPKGRFSSGRRSAFLTEIQVLEIRDRYKNERLKDLALEFGVSRYVLYNAARGRSWKDI